MPDAQPELSDAPLALGIYGKMPAHGDFVRRGLPSSFVTPWDTWLSAGVAAARGELDTNFAAVWDEAPAWRFALPAGVCGPDAVAGVMLPSEDTVGRRFPLTAAALLPPGVIIEECWFARLEATVRAARQGSLDADGMIRAMQSSAEVPGSGDVLGMLGSGLAEGGPAAGPVGDVGASAAPVALDGWGSSFGVDPMEGPAAAPAAAEDMWGALLGDAPSDGVSAAGAGQGPSALADGSDAWGTAPDDLNIQASLSSDMMEGPAAVADGENGGKVPLGGSTIRRSSDTDATQAPSARTDRGNGGTGLPGGTSAQEPLNSDAFGPSAQGGSGNRNDLPGGMPDEVSLMKDAGRVPSAMLGANPLHTASGQDAMEGPASDDDWSAPSSNVPTQAATAEDAFDGPASTPDNADHWDALVGDISSPAAPSKDASSAAAGALGDGAFLMADAPLDAASVGGAASLNSTLPDTGDMWGDLLGDPAPPSSDGFSPAASEGGDPALPAASAGGEPPGTVWDDVLANTVDLRPATTHQGTAPHEPAPVPEDTPVGDRWGELLGDDRSEKPAVGATDGTASAMPAAIASDRIYPADLPSDAVGALPTDQSNVSTPPTYEALLRPEHGGWWTLGGAHLSPMVWPLPELPPAASFILLLHNQDPETGP